MDKAWKDSLEKIGDKIVDATAHIAVSGIGSVVGAEQATAYAVENVGGGILAEHLIGSSAGVIGGMVGGAVGSALYRNLPHADEVRPRRVPPMSLQAPMPPQASMNQVTGMQFHFLSQNDNSHLIKEIANQRNMIQKESEARRFAETQASAAMKVANEAFNKLKAKEELDKARRISQESKDDINSIGSQFQKSISKLIQLENDAIAPKEKIDKLTYDGIPQSQLVQDLQLQVSTQEPPALLDEQNVSQRTLFETLQGESSPPATNESVHDQLRSLHNIVEELRAQIKDLVAQREEDRANHQATEQEWHVLSEAFNELIDNDDQYSEDEDDTNQTNVNDGNWDHVDNWEDAPFENEDSSGEESGSNETNQSKGSSDGQVIDDQASIRTE